MPERLKRFLRECDNGTAQDIFDWLFEERNLRAELVDELWDSHPEIFPELNDKG